MQTVGVHKMLCSGPGDLTQVQALIDAGQLNPSHIVAVMGKTEGNGCVNDFTREYATQAWCTMLAPYLDAPPSEVERRIAFVMSGGTEGVLSPHFTVFTRTRLDTSPVNNTARLFKSSGKRLAIGVAFTRRFLPEEIGSLVQVEETRRAVLEAMEDAGIMRAEDVHFVQIKCPLLTSSRIAAAAARGKKTLVQDTYESMAISRGASALGVGIALGEVDGEKLSQVSICHDASLYSSVASTSAGIELEYNVLILMGMSEMADSGFAVTHGVMKDAIDGASVQACLNTLREMHRDAQVVNVFAKAEAAANGKIRGNRHTMLNDSDIHSTRHARAAVGAVLASITGDTAMYVSGGAEHQGPSGGGPFSIVVRT